MFLLFSFDISISISIRKTNTFVLYRLGKDYKFIIMFSTASQDKEFEGFEKESEKKI